MNALPPNAGKGRPQGVPNKVTRAIKEMVTQALDKAGGIDYLVKQADVNPAAFLGLVGKIIPKEVDSNVTLAAQSPEEAEARAAWAKAEVEEMFGTAIGGPPSTR